MESEPRRTAWIQTESLGDFLMGDHTVEGVPPPHREGGESEAEDMYWVYLSCQARC